MAKKGIVQQISHPKIRSFNIGITGESFFNEDGSNRQEILRRCKVGEQLHLIHEPIPQDINAVKVCRMNGEQIGYIPQYASAEFATIIQRNIKQDIEISEIKSGQYIGCRLKVTRYDDDLSWNEKHKRAQQWYSCPNCSAQVTYGVISCPRCNQNFTWPSQSINQTISGLRCIHCGSSIIPVKGKFGWLWFFFWLLCGGLPAIIYLFYHAGKRADRCPVCNKKAYK